MKTSVIVVGALLTALLLICAVVMARRLQRLTAQRSDAEQRAAVAFEEMARLTRELRALRDQSDEGAAEPAASVGERLRARYPGSTTAHASRDVEGG